MNPADLRLGEKSDAFFADSTGRTGRLCKMYLPNGAFRRQADRHKQVTGTAGCRRGAADLAWPLAIRPGR